MQQLNQVQAIKLQIVAFGTHTALAFGNTVEDIKQDGYKVDIELPCVLNGNTPNTIAVSMANTMSQFAEVWNSLPTDLIICLGDRYEMFAAVAASVPFAIPIAHLHGGETTLGAIDNVFRHSLTHMASLHFAGCEAYRQRIIELKGSDDWVINTGALSIDNLHSLALFSPNEFLQKFGVDISKPTILTTFHPETVSFSKNEEFVKELSTALEILAEDFQVIITMPNADTMGNVVRKELLLLRQRNRSNIFCFENLGTIGYLSAMKYCAILVGNTSSGFVEASYFPKWVVNLGSRQNGRLQMGNIQTIKIDKAQIVKTVKTLVEAPVPSVNHPYGNGNAASQMLQYIIKFIKNFRGNK